jgi:hypothetical protein
LGIHFSIFPLAFSFENWHIITMPAVTARQQIKASFYADPIWGSTPMANCMKKHTRVDFAQINIIPPPPPPIFSVKKYNFFIFSSLSFQ